MGMFDTFKYKGREWQTKDLACNMDVYVVADDGTVEKQEIDDGIYYPIESPDLSHLHGLFTACDFAKDEKRLEWARFKFTDGKLVDFKELGHA